MKDIKKKKFLMEFDPMGWTGHGQFLIKVDDSVRTPFASVFVGIGLAKKEAIEGARLRAERIVKI